MAQFFQNYFQLSSRADKKAPKKNPDKAKKSKNPKKTPKKIPKDLMADHLDILDMEKMIKKLKISLESPDSGLSDCSVKHRIKFKKDEKPQKKDRRTKK